MTDTGGRITPSAEQFDLLAEVIHQVVRRRRLRKEDAEDFAQTVHLKLLERGYEAFGQFVGLSSLRTYVTVVVQRILIDWQRSQYGKWRASAAARRLGESAVELEQLMFRDRHTLDEAIGILQSRSNRVPTSELRRLAEQIPARCSRRVVAMQDLDALMSAPNEDPLDRLEREQNARALRRWLPAALRRLAAEDRLLLNLRYCQSQRVPVIARLLRTDGKVVYRRCDKALGLVRTFLAPHVSLPRGTPKRQRKARTVDDARIGEPH